MYVNTNNHYYEESADAKHSLIDSINTATPLKSKGSVFHGYTKYQINWQFRWQIRNHRCQITSVKIVVDLDYTLPKLKSHNAEVRKIWRNWIPKLRQHEENHGEITLNAAYLLDEKMRALPPQKSCKTLEKNANNLGYGILDELAEEHTKYDNKTNHGETEQAWIYQHL